MEVGKTRFLSNLLLPICLYGINVSAMEFELRECLEARTDGWLFVISREVRKDFLFPIFVKESL